MQHARLRRYLRHGTLPQLVAFEATARLGSCSRAAEQLHQSQPTVSIHIKKLSEALGLALFEREGRGLRLTAAGREVYETCHRLFSTFEELDERLHGEPEVLPGVASLPFRRADLDSRAYAKAAGHI